MSDFKALLKRHRFELVMFPLMAAQFYVWWRLQEMYVPEADRKNIPINAFEFAKKLYGQSSEKDNKEKSVN